MAVSLSHPLFCWFGDQKWESETLPWYNLFVILFQIALLTLVVFYMQLLFLQTMVVPCLTSSTSLSIALLALVVENILCVIALPPNPYAQWRPLSHKFYLSECLSLEPAIIQFGYNYCTEQATKMTLFAITARFWFW